MLEYGPGKRTFVTIKTFTAKKIINKLRKAEIRLSQGATIKEASRKIGY